MRNSKQKRLEWKKTLSGNGIITRYYFRRDLIDAFMSLAKIHKNIEDNKLQRIGGIKQSILNIFHLCNINYPIITNMPNNVKMAILIKVENFIYYYGDKYEIANKLLKYINAKLKGVDITTIDGYNKTIHETYEKYRYSRKIFKLKKRIIKKVFNNIYFHILRLF